MNHGQPSIKTSLLRTMVLLVVLTSSAILVVDWIGALQSVRSLTKTVIHRSMQEVRAEVETVFAPVVRSLEMSLYWGQLGVLDFVAEVDDGARPRSAALGRQQQETMRRLNMFFIPVMRQLPQVVSMMIASSDGLEYVLFNGEESWTSRMVRADDWGTQTLWATWNERGELLNSEWRDFPYDPRENDYFREVMARGTREESVWTGAYTFATTREPGITVGSRWTSENSKQIFVVAYDIAVGDLSEFTSGLRVGESGFAVVSFPGQALGLPRSPELQSASARAAAFLKPVDQLGIPALTAGARTWEQLGRTEEPLSFESAGETWWWQTGDMRLDSERILHVSITVPEEDFLAEVHHGQRVMLVIAFAAILVAIVVAIRQSLKYSRPLEMLAAQSHRISQLDLEPGMEIPGKLRELRQLATQQEEMRKALDSFSRYVPVDVVRELLERGEVAKMGGRTETLTVLFTDIRGFTAIAERLSPQALTAHLSEYFEAMLEVLLSEHATVDKLIGDAIMAFWNAPNPDVSHVKRAVLAAWRCMHREIALNEAWSHRGLPSLHTCFGIACGEVVVGNIGAPHRLAYTVLGDTVNLASRLEGLNRVYDTTILIGEQVNLQVCDAFHTRLVDRVAVKGRMRPVNVFEVLGPHGEVSAERLAFARRYEEAFEHYVSRRFAEALYILDGLETDASVAHLARSCQDFLREGPPGDWDGSTRRMTK